MKDLIIHKAKQPFSIREDDTSGIRIVKRPDFIPTHPPLFKLSNEAGPRTFYREGMIPEEIVSNFVNITKLVAPVHNCAELPTINLKEYIEPSNAIRGLLNPTLEMPLPDWFNDPLEIKSALAYPDFEDPMYEKLKELSTEWLIPNLHLIPNNTVILLQPNRKFIEAFMVGLNVEMNREMMWREFPTDERGSCFRQFWDVKGIKSFDRHEDEKHIPYEAILHQRS